MNLQDIRLVPLQPAGTGRLARFAGVVVFVGEDATRIATATLLDTCRTHAANSDRQGGELVTKVAGILTRAKGADLPPFALIAQEGDGLAVAISGPIEVLVEQPAGPLRLGGGAPGTWVTSVAHDAAYASALPVGASLDAVGALVDLERGVVAAGGFVMLASGVSPGDLLAGVRAASVGTEPVGTATGGTATGATATGDITDQVSPPSGPPAPPALDEPAPRTGCSRYSRPDLAPWPKSRQPSRISPRPSRQPSRMSRRPPSWPNPKLPRRPLGWPCPRPADSLALAEPAMELPEPVALVEPAAEFAMAAPGGDEAASEAPVFSVIDVPEAPVFSVSETAAIAAAESGEDQGAPGDPTPSAEPSAPLPAPPEAESMPSWPPAPPFGAATEAPYLEPPPAPEPAMWPAAPFAAPSPIGAPPLAATRTLGALSRPRRAAVSPFRRRARPRDALPVDRHPRVGPAGAASTARRGTHGRRVDAQQPLAARLARPLGRFAARRCGSRRTAPARGLQPGFAGAAPAPRGTVRRLPPGTAGARAPGTASRGRRLSSRCPPSEPPADPRRRPPPRSEPRLGCRRPSHLRCPRRRCSPSPPLRRRNRPRPRPRRSRRREPGFRRHRRSPRAAHRPTGSSACSTPTRPRR